MIDITHRINAAARTVGTRTLEAGEARVITVARTFPDPVEEVWDACTTAERRNCLAAGYHPPGVKGRPRAPPLRPRATCLRFSRRSAANAFASLEESLLPVRSPLGDEWLLEGDEPAVRADEATDAPARLLPSGDAYFLLHGAERELLVPQANRRQLLWTSRVWPGALLVDGEIRGTWRRAQHTVRVDAWARLSPAMRDAVEAEAAGLPLQGVDRRIEVVWET